MGLKLVKIGGSAISREGCEDLFDIENVRRIANELRPYSRHCILVHGTGAVGKRPALRHDYFRTGIIAADSASLAVAVRGALRDLNRRFLSVLLEAGIKGLPLDTARYFSEDGDDFLQDGTAESLALAARCGVVPVFYGDLIPRQDGSFRVMSSDAIMSILVRALQPEGAFMFTNVDGVYGCSESDPGRRGDVIRTLSPSNRGDMYRAPGDEKDVSGGMRQKVEHTLEISRHCGECTIASGLVPGVIAGVLGGKDVVCTRVKQDSVSKAGAVCRCLVLLFSLLWTSSCMSPTGRFAGGFVNGMGRAPDPRIARDGIPACILMIEGFLSASPDDPRLLEAAAGLYSFYGSQLVQDEGEARRITDRALTYAMRAADTRIPGAGDARRMGIKSLKEKMGRVREADLPTLFSLGSVWADWVRVRRDDLAAIGDLPRIEAIMERVVQLNGDYRAGSGHLYLAVLAMSLPSADEVIEAHFRCAMAPATGKNLMPEVLYALWQRDRGHVQESRQLLRNIVARGLPADPDYSLMNQMALDKAKQALDEQETQE